VPYTICIDQSTMHNIYFIGQADKPHWFGWGQTKGELMIESHGIPRFGSDYNKARDALVKYTDLGFYERVLVRDKKIHNFLKKQPGIKKVGTESFEITGCNLTLDIVKDMVEKNFFSTTPATRKTLKLRPHQRDFIAKAQADYLEFLLFAKCRAGKCVMVLSHIVYRGHKLSLVVSRFKSPVQSWAEDPNKYDLFENVRIIRLDEPNWTEDLNYWLNQDVQIVLWSTVQGLQRKINKVKSFTDVDLLVFDECHIGDNAKQFVKIRDSLSDTPCLKISGTAYDQVWCYPKENRYSYSYWDEQYAVMHHGYEAPKMNVITIDVDVPGYQDIFGDDPDALKNLFLTENRKFVNESLVVDFIHKYFGNQRHIRDKDQRLLNNSRHIYMCLPSKDACHAFAELITSYSPLVVTSDTKNTSDDINKHVKENEKTICLTFGANVLGVTQKEWDTVINCREGMDLKFWTQFAFRGGSGDNDWKMIDFSPRRALRAITESFVLAREENPKLLEHELVEFVNIIEWEEGFTTLSQDKINDVLSVHAGEDAPKSFSNLAVSVLESDLADYDFDKINVSTLAKPVASFRDVNDNACNQRSALKVIKVGDEEKKEKVISNKEKLREIYRSIPLILSHEINSGNQVDSIEQVLSCSSYAPVSQDSDGVLKQLIDDKVINPNSIANKISLWNPVIKKSLDSNFTKTIDAFSFSKSTQQPIDLSLLKTILSHKVNNLLIVGDPSGVHSSYAVKELGIHPSKITVWEDHPTHVFLIKSISSEINIVPNLEDASMNGKSFDYCLGNPPYSDRENKKYSNKKLWKIFLFESMKRAKTTTFVLPASVLSASDHFEQIRPYISYININAAKYFRGVGSKFCVITVENTVQDKCSVETANEKFDIVLKDIPLLPNVITEDNIDYVKKTLTGGREWKVSCDYHSAYKDKWESADGKIEVLHTTNQSFYTNKDVALNNEIRVAISKSGEPKFKVVHKKGLSESMIYTTGFNDIEEAQDYCDYCNSPKIQKAITLTKFSGWNTKELIKHIP